MRLRLIGVLFFALIVGIPATLVQAAGTREDPVPFGEAATVGAWKLTVVDVNRDAYEVLAESIDYVDVRPPADGNVYVLVQVKAEYLADEPLNLGVDLIERAVGPSSVAYDYKTECPSYPDQAFAAPDVFKGGVVEVNYCWEVTKEDAPGLLIYFKPFLEPELVFFSLEEAVGTPVASPEG